MVESVLKVVSNSALLVVSITVYLVILLRVIPGRVLKPVYAVKPGDRGLRRCLLPEGRAVVYEPGCRRAPSILQYVLIVSSETGNRLLKCMTDGKTEKLGYDVAVFNRFGSMTDIIRVNEDLHCAQWTRALVLPAHTNYVSLIQRTRNDVRVSDEQVFTSTLKERIVTVCICVLMTAVLAAVMRVTAYGILYEMIYINEPQPESWFVTCLIGALFGAAVGGCMLLCDRKLTRKVINR